MATYNAGESVGTYTLRTQDAERAAQRMIAFYQQLDAAAARASQNTLGTPINVPTAPQQPPQPRPNNTPSIVAETRALAALEAQQARLARSQGDEARATQLETQSIERLQAAIIKASAAGERQVGIERQLTGVQQQRQTAANSYAATLARVDAAIKIESNDAAKQNALLTEQVRLRRALANLPPPKPTTPTPTPIQKEDSAAAGVARLAASYITLQGAQQGLDFVKQGAAIESQRQSFDNLAASANTTGDVLLNSLRKAASGTIKDAQLIESANTGILLTQGRIINDLPRLIEVARASAQATGQDIGFVFDSLVRGIARGSPQIIDNAGITLDAASAFDAYAKSIGTTSDKLTDQQKQQATLQAVLSAGTDIINQVGLDSESSAASIARAETALSDFADTLKTKVAPAAAGVAKWVADGVNSLNTYDAQVESLKGTLLDGAGSFDEYQQRASYANRALYRELGVTIPILNSEQYKLAKAFQDTGLSAQEAAAKVEPYAQALDNVRKSGTFLLEGGLPTQSITDLTARLDALTLAGGQTSTATAEMVQRFLDHKISADQLAAGVAALEVAQRAQADAAAQDAVETQRLDRANQDAAPAIDATTQAIADSILKKSDAAEQSERLGTAEAFIADIGKQVAGGLITAADGARILGDKFGYAADEAERLTLRSAEAARVSAAQEARGNFLSSLLKFGGQAVAQAKEQQAVQVALHDRIERTGTAQQRLNQAQADYNRVVARYGKESSQAANAQTKVIEAQQAADAERKRNNKANAPARLKDPGLTTRDREELKSLENDEARLASLRQQYAQIQNKESLKAIQLGNEIRELEEKITEQKQKQLETQLSLREAIIDDRRLRREEQEQLEDLSRILNDARFSDEQRAEAADKIAKIEVGQQQRAAKIADQQRELGQTPTTQPTQAPEAPTVVQPTVTLPDRPIPVVLPQQPAIALPPQPIPVVLPTVPPPVTVPAVPQTINLTVNVDQAGRATVPAPNTPGIDLNVITRAGFQALLSGGAP